MKRVTAFLATGFILAALQTTTAQTTILDDFEADEGRFAGDANSSGSSAGMFKATSTFTHDTTLSLSGTGSQMVFVDDDAATDGLAGVYSWRLRHLSGAGTIANNVSLANGANAFVGYYLMTTTPNLFASLLIDDFDAAVNTHERAEYKPIIADGQWHLYEWNLGNANDWTAFAGTGADGIVDNATVTIDSIYISMADDPADRDATFWLDNVAFNPTGQLPAVPEPPTMALGLLAGLGLLVGMARRRAR